MLITQTELARIRKVTPQAINNLVKRKRLPAYGKKKQVKLEEALRILDDELDPAWDQQKFEMAAPVPTVAAGVDDDDAGGDSFRDARTRQALITAERQQFELDRQRGLYLPKAEVERAMQAAGLKIRRVLDTLPQMADELFSAAQGGSAADLKKLLKEKTRRFEESLAQAVRLGATEDDAQPGA